MVSLTKARPFSVACECIEVEKERRGVLCVSSQGIVFKNYHAHPPPSFKMEIKNTVGMLGWAGLAGLVRPPLSVQGTLWCKKKCS